MKRFFYSTLVTAVAVSGAALIGCGKSEPPADPPAGEEVIEHPAADIDQTGIDEALAELPEADQEAARAQAICPVSQEPLGSMGAPIKVTVNGREVFVCCAGCENPLLEDPEKYLANL